MWPAEERTTIIVAAKNKRVGEDLMCVPNMHFRNAEGEEKATVLVGRCRGSKMITANVVLGQGAS